MRYLLLLLCSIAYAEDQQFTLKDGRVLVGSYDEASQTLAIANPKASIRVDERDIVKREEAPAAPAPKIAEKKADKTDAAAPPSAAPTYIVKLQAAISAAYDAQVKFRAATEALRSEQDAATHSFLQTMDASPVQAELSSKSPSPEDMQKYREIQAFNSDLKVLHDTFAQGGTNYQEIMTEHFLEMYARLKGAPWVVSLRK